MAAWHRPEPTTSCEGCLSSEIAAASATCLSAGTSVDGAAASAASRPRPEAAGGWSGPAAETSEELVSRDRLLGDDFGGVESRSTLGVRVTCRASLNSFGDLEEVLQEWGAGKELKEILGGRDFKGGPPGGPPEDPPGGIPPYP